MNGFFCKAQQHDPAGGSCPTQCRECSLPRGPQLVATLERCAAVMAEFERLVREASATLGCACDSDSIVPAIRALRREGEAGYARGVRDARGQFGVAVDLLRETLSPLEVCAATIESEDGGALMESLLGQVRRFVADAGLLVPERQADAMAVLLRACKAAAEWLQGWASAEPYLAQLHAAIAAAAPYAPLDGEPEFQSWIQQLRGYDAAGNPRERYALIRFDGSWCICKPGDVAAMVPSEDADAYQVEDVYMSPQEVEALPEFQGW